jgi:hypothetical protein
LTAAGRICGIIGTVLLLISVVVGLGFAMLAVLGVMAHH